MAVPEPPLGCDLSRPPNHDIWYQVELSIYPTLENVRMTNAHPAHKLDGKDEAQRRPSRLR